MRDTFTPAARRTVASCRRMAAGASAPQTWCDFLMFALLQDESLASAAMQRRGISAGSLLTLRHSQQALEHASTHLQQDADIISDECSAHAEQVIELDDPLEFTQILDRAAFLARSDQIATEISSAHLLLALFEMNELLRKQLTDDGVDRESIAAELKFDTVVSGPSLPIDVEIIWSASPAASVPGYSAPESIEAEAAWRILDANLNRSREGLRVLEDYARFVRNDANLSGQLKDLRHELVAAESLLPKLKTENRQANADGAFARELLLHRDTAHDVGTQISTAAESSRNEMSSVVIANSRRVQEALRSLEEFGKLIAPEFSATVKQIRYRSYTLQQQLISVGDTIRSPEPHNFRVQKLNDAVLYVLITESVCRLPWRQVVEATLRGGAEVLQLREKHLNDRELLRRARWMADASRGAGCLFIVNDRADAAVAANADGVHVGQDEFAVSDARAVLRPDQVLGVSTHTLAQAQAAEAEGTDYIGVGPTFPTTTKSFPDIPGLALVTEVSRNINIPAFAIGGIDVKNIEAVRQAGGTRAAATWSVIGSEDAESAVRELKRQLGKLSKP